MEQRILPDDLKRPPKLGKHWQTVIALVFTGAIFLALGFFVHLGR